MIKYKFQIFIIFLSIFLFSSSLSFSQTQKSSAERSRSIDSLLSLLKTAKQDTSRVNTLNALAWELRHNNPDSAIIIGNQSLYLSEKIRWTKGIASSLGQLGVYYRHKSDYSKALDYYLKALTIDKELKDKVGMSKRLNNIGSVYLNQSNYSRALDYYFKALKIDEELGNKNGIAADLGNIGVVYHEQGDYTNALDYYLRALRLEEELEDKNGIAANLGNIGSVYKNQTDYPNALEYYFKALKMQEELGNKNGIMSNLGNIGIVYKNQADYPKALDCYFNALKIAEEIGDKKSTIINLGNIGNIYAEQAYYPKALEYYLKSLKIREELGIKNYIAIQLANIASLYSKQKKYAMALDYAGRSLNLSKEIGAIDLERQFEQILYETYKAMGNTKKALKHYEKYILLRDSIFKLDNQKEILRKQMKFDYEKKAAADSVKNAEEQKVKEAQIQAQQAQIKQERTQRYALYGGLSFVVVFAGFIFNRFRVTQKQKKIIEEQKKIVEIKNEDILDSIHYAQRIQQALLPPDSYLRENLPEHFIFYKPKDIVSGDFYWVAPLNPPQGGRLDIVKSMANAIDSEFESPLGGDLGGLLFCIADCTGHGVPGAFMSLLGISFLNEIIKERNITSPGKALDMLRAEIIRNMNPDLPSEASAKDGGREDIKDGMEIALCKYNFAEKILEYSSANIKLLLVRTPRPPEGGVPKSPSGDLGVGKREIIELETDAMPVGVDFQASKPFNQHQIALETGDMLYTFSDGYADQFGGPTSSSPQLGGTRGAGKRFKRGKLKELLLSISNKPVGEQKSILENTFNDWKGNLEQTDDVTVIGIRI